MLECGIAAATGSMYICTGDKLIRFVLSPESEIPFHQCCLSTIPLRRILSKSNGGTCREPEFRHSFYEGEEFWQLKAVSFAGKDTGLGFLLTVTLRSHHPEPEELWTLESEDEFAIRLQGRCSGLTALKH